MLVEVQRFQVELGQRSDCASCPVALALRFAFPHHDVWVGGREFRLTPMREHLRGGWTFLPPHVARAIQHYDMCGDDGLIGLRFEVSPCYRNGTPAPLEARRCRPRRGAA